MALDITITFIGLASVQLPQRWTGKTMRTFVAWPLLSCEIISVQSGLQACHRDLNHLSNCFSATQLCESHQVPAQLCPIRTFRGQLSLMSHQPPPRENDG